MMIFHACIPSGWRVSGMTVLPLTRPGLRRRRGSPSSEAATKSSNGTRYGARAQGGAPRGWGVAPRLEPGQRALGDASDIRDVGQRQLAVRAQSLDSWADLVERGRDRGGGFLLPEVHLTLDSRERQR
jgi:hypothetical protein